MKCEAVPCTGTACRQIFNICRLDVGIGPYIALFCSYIRNDYTLQKDIFISFSAPSSLDNHELDSSTDLNSFVNQVSPVEPKDNSYSVIAHMPRPRPPPTPPPGPRPGPYYPGPPGPSPPATPGGGGPRQPPKASFTEPPQPLETDREAGPEPPPTP